MFSRVFVMVLFLALAKAAVGLGLSNTSDVGLRLSLKQKGLEKGWCRSIVQCGMDVVCR